VKLHFHGTRGYIEVQTKRHRRHSVCTVSYRRSRVTIDCGEDWLDRLEELKARSILITHAHPDHAGGLARGSHCPVYATGEAWETLQAYPIEQRRRVRPRESFRIGELHIEAFPVAHSTRAPAVGYRISGGRVTVFYVPDLVFIEEREEALRGVKVYIGDGAAITRSLVRKPGEELIGHTPVRTQLTWCQKFGVPHMIVTHCGTRIVENDPGSAPKRIGELARERGVKAEIARDGMEVVLR
jgi:phosphoribosyl 1,2-cyclic phosphodiesterase